MYEVMRPFGGPDGRTLERGDLVDASGWRNLRALVNMGRLKPVQAPKATTPKATKTAKAETADNA